MFYVSIEGLTFIVHEERIEGIKADFFQEHKRYRVNNNIAETLYA